MGFRKGDKTVKDSVINCFKNLKYPYSYWIV